MYFYFRCGLINTPIKTLLLSFLLIHFQSSLLSQVKDTDTLAFSADNYRTIALNDPLIDEKEITVVKTNGNSDLPSFLNSTNLSGEWWGVRNLLQESGLDFEFNYKGDVFSNISGGAKKGTEYLDNFDLIFSADLEKSLNWEGSMITAQFIGNHGGTPGDLVEASQGISNIETIPTWKLYQLLFEKTFLENQFSVAVGLYDLNSEFDVRESSGLFLNPSHGIGDEIAKSGLNGPSIFPTTSLTLRLKYETPSGNYFQAAVLDGVPGNPGNPYGTHIMFNKNDGLLLCAEYGMVKSENEIMDSKIAFGAWLYTSESEVNSFVETPGKNSLLENNYGFYLTAEKLLLSKRSDPAKGITGFLRIGYANKNINPVDYYLGAGFKINGFIEDRENDEFGVAIAMSHNSLEYRNVVAFIEDTNIKPFELNVEATYLIQLTPWLKFQPDIQYIVNPSYCSTSNTAFVVGSRLEINF